MHTLTGNDAAALTLNDRQHGVRVVVDLAIEKEQPFLPSGTAGGRWQGERST